MPGLPIDSQFANRRLFVPALENKQNEEGRLREQAHGKTDNRATYRRGVVRDLHLTARALQRKNELHQPPACSNVSAPRL